MKKSSLTSTVIIVIVVAVALIAYFYYKGSGSSSQSSSLLSQTSTDSSMIGNQILGLLNQIQSLRIDSTLFTDPGYQTLRDFSVAIPPENVGRSNPFAPLPGAPARGAGGSSGR
jgi:hypothetical protein